MADNLVPNCVGRIVPVNSACGCTLTATTIQGLAPQDIVNLGYKEIYLTKAILEAAEAKMLGIPENPLMDLLNSRIKDIKDKLTIQKVDEQSIVQPFIQRRQRAVNNVNYFIVSAGIAAPGAGTGNIPASAWQLTLGLSASPWQNPLQAISRYFVPGMTILLRTWDNVVTKTARTLQFTIISSTEADVGSTPYANVVVYPPVSAANWTAYTNAQRLVYQPTFGLAEFGHNSIHDRESYCNNLASDMSMNLVVNWLQTSRESYCREQSYEQTLDQILKGKVNDYLKGFVFTSIAEQQKQMKAAYDRAWFNSVFFGQAIDVDNQTVQNWQNLPQVYDLVNPSCSLAYKANALGIFTLLNECTRVVDLQGLPLNLNSIFNALYYLKRIRATGADRILVIDSMTDRYTASSIFETMTKYYKARYNWLTERFAKMGEKITHDGMMMFEYDIYDVKEAGVKWAVFQLDYFNDLVDAAAVPEVGWSLSTRVNNLWFIDWSDVTVGVAGQKSVQRKSPNPNTDLALWQCVIDPNVRSYDLRSKIWTVMVDRPNRHLIYHNYASGCPDVSIPNCLVPQS
jgi:hypothetical protein